MPPSGFTVDLSTHRIVRWKKSFLIQDKATTHATHIIGRSGASLSADLSAPGKKIVSFYTLSSYGNDDGFVHYEDGEVSYLSFSHNGLYSSSWGHLRRTTYSSRGTN